MNKYWLISYTYEDYIKDIQKADFVNGVKEYTAEDILLCREERVCDQEKLIELYNNTLIFMRVNYPGIIKNNDITFGIMEFMNKFLVGKFKKYIVYKKFTTTAEGPVLTLLINKSPEETKKITVNIENSHFLGRYVDIDVYDKNNNSLSRATVGLKPRRCYICSDIAQNCVRSEKHNIQEIKEFIKDKYEDYCKWCKLF